MIILYKVQVKAFFPYLGYLNCRSLLGISLPPVVVYYCLKRMTRIETT